MAVGLQSAVKDGSLGQKNNRMWHFHTILNVLGFRSSFRRRLLQYFVAKKETLLCQQQILARPRKYAQPPPTPSRTHNRNIGLCLTLCFEQTHLNRV
jgi:hypothetical protein